MNAFKDGSLVGVSIRNWVTGHVWFNSFFNAMMISEQDHEEWYGDRKTAKAMEKEQLRKNFRCKLEFLDMEKSGTMAGDLFRYKNTKKFSKP